MLPKVKKNLRTMKSDRPGHRFRNQHKRAAADGASNGWERALFIGGAVVSFAIGVVLVVLPGPAFVFFIISGALLASQWRPVAVLMDHLELSLRNGASWVGRKWSGRPDWLGGHRGKPRRHRA